MARSKKLTTQDIQKEISQYEKLKKVVFDDGMYTEIYEKFSPEKIDELIDDFADFIVKFEDRNGKINSSNFQKFLYLHIVKHFSTLCPEIPSSDEEKFSLINNLAKSRYVRELQDKYDPKEISYVYDTLSQRIQIAVDLIEASKKVRDEIKKTILNDKRIKNREVLSEVFLGKKLLQKEKSKNGERIQKSE